MNTFPITIAPIPVAELVAAAAIAAVVAVGKCVAVVATVVVTVLTVGARRVRTVSSFPVPLETAFDVAAGSNPTELEDVAKNRSLARRRGWSSGGR